MSERSELRRLGRALFPLVNRPWWYFWVHPGRPGGWLWRIRYALYLRRREREIRAEALAAGLPYPPIGSYDYRRGWMGPNGWQRDLPRGPP